MADPSGATTSDYDVVVVGGRVAGSSLAARLARRGTRILLLDRATLPSLPQVPSSPIIHAGTMALLDELGIAETLYGDDHARQTHYFFEMGAHFGTEMKIPQMFGRDYIYGVQRDRFDSVLWDSVAALPTVQRRDGVNVTGLLRATDGTVGGVVVSEHGGTEEQITARAVVGADGRFSAIARLAQAPVVDERMEHVSTVYYADWENVERIRPRMQAAHIHATGKGLDILFFAMPDGRFNVNTHERADRVNIDGDADAYYEGTLRKIPQVWRRLANARRVTDVIGIKRIGNGYRKASGPGWVLTGDALHYKDPVDGQGIYDALVTSKALAEALGSWLDGSQSWDSAMSAYSATVRRETYAMYKVTTARLKRELYSEPPPFIAKTLIRWTMTDPSWQDGFVRLLARDLSADNWPPRGLARGAVVRGLRRDVARKLGSH